MSTHTEFGALRILIVDSDPVMSSLAAFMLTSCGVQYFRKAGSLQDALTDFASGQFNLVLAGCTPLDEEFDRFVVTLRDPETSDTPEVPIIVYTALTTLSAILKAARAGVSLVLCKPMSAKSLADHIDAIMSTPVRFEKKEGTLRPAWPPHLAGLLEAKPALLVAVSDNGEDEEQLSSAVASTSRMVVEI